MKRYLLTCYLLLSALALRAQPGGGGGIGFGQLYGRDGGRLQPISWEAAQARVFYLATAAGQPVGPATPIGTENYRPNFEHLDALKGLRLLLVYRADTMQLDLTNLLEPNGAGNVHRFDSLVVMPGYFHFSDSLPYEINQIKGFTPHGAAQLQARRLLRYQSRGDYSFLAPRRLSADYYMALAQYHLSRQQPQSVLTALNAAEARQPDLRTQVASMSLRALAYRQLGQYAKALRWATQGLEQARRAYSPIRLVDGYLDHNSFSSLASQYVLRQHLYLLLHKYSAALADYDALASIWQSIAPPMARQEKDTIPWAIDRALFMADSLHRPTAYHKAILLLRQQLEPRENLSAWPCNRQMHHQSNYRELNATHEYFRLGTAEYRVGQYAAAFGHWYQALAGGHAHQQASGLVAHFDSVLERHPRQPLLLMGRAVAHLSNYESPTHTVADRQRNLALALADLAQAEALGYSTADVPYYRALIFKEQHRWADMRRALDAAIAQQPTAGELYSLRHSARLGLGETTNAEYATDPDWLAHKRLCSDEH